ncbi:hypothetical protein [Aeromicrobium sp.]|uniref:hypothetical protein n=1 Tax=Aeromicrobium sp. TaxID=1871063 RepID=UPI0028AD5403|nr:hypothetical protein [Aeromicrobium sp.]
MSRRRVLALTTLVLSLLSLWALAVGSSIPAPIVDLEASASLSDESLYDVVIERVKTGESYYRAAADAQADAGYPTSPPPTIRLPTTTWLVALLGDWAPWVLRGLIIMTALVAMVRFERLAPTRAEWLVSTLALAAGIGVFAHPRAVVLSEAWVACLLALSLLLHRPGRYRLSVALGFVAVCFRELAVPYLVVMAFLAWRRDRRESWAWAVALLVFSVFYAIHWVLGSRAAAGQTSVKSPSWLEFGGWPYVVDTFGFSSVLRPLPYEVWVAALALALLGWAGMAGHYRDRVLVLAVGFMAIFLFVGRPDTAYWGRLYFAWVIPGLAFAPRAVKDLVMRRDE